MNDNKRDSIIRGSAFGYLITIFLFFFLILILGKNIGALLLFILILPYSLYYTLMYWILSKGYDDDSKKMMSFGVLSRFTFVGIIFHLALAMSLMLSSLIIAGLYEYFK